MPTIQYKFLNGQRVWIHRLHDITQDRYGLFEGRCTWMTAPDYFPNAIPAANSGHPLYPWLELERWSSRTQGAFVAIEAEYYGISGNESEPVYELSNSAGEFPIEGHPNFDGILSGAGLERSDVVDENDRFIGFPVNPPGENNYPTGRNLSGVEAFLGYGEVVWRKVWNARSAPSGGNLQVIGKVDSPEGNPPTPSGRDWILITNSFNQRGKTYRRTKEWKLSGPDGANPDIYNYS